MGETLPGGSLPVEPSVRPPGGGPDDTAVQGDALENVEAIEAIEASEDADAIGPGEETQVDATKPGGLAGHRERGRERDRAREDAAPPPASPPPPARTPPARPQPGRPAPLPAPAAPPKARPAAQAAEAPSELSLAAELRARADRLRASDPVGAARGMVELGIYEERIRFDRAAARACYDAAAKLSRGLEPAVYRSRRLLEGKAERPAALLLLDDEIAAAPSDLVRADFLAERARLSESLGRVEEARRSYERALSLAPAHPASLRGLEATLRRALDAEKGAARRPLADALAALLERAAEAAAPGQGSGGKEGDARAAAWMLVERAALLDAELGKADLAQASLERAVALDGAPGPVRRAYVRHLIRHGRVDALVTALSVEAEREPDSDRASRLYYAAARALVLQLGSPAVAIELLTRAAARMPEATPTARRIFAELIRLLEEAGELTEAAALRERRLPLLERPEVVAHELTRLSDLHAAIGDAEKAAYFASRVLEADPEDEGGRERLDRALAQLGRHAERVKVWLAAASRETPAASRRAAFLAAADIAERHLRRRDEAIAHLRAAWAVEPGDPDVFDQLSALLEPKAPSPDEDPRNARARLDLYAEAARAATDPERRIGLLEKLALIREEELGDPARAAEEIEKILAIDPKRRSAIVAIQRLSAKAGDFTRLVKALVAESEIALGAAEKRRQLLRAAEITAERLGDPARAVPLVERALALGEDPLALRAKERLLEKAGRFEEARKVLVVLATRAGRSPEAFSLWVEIARVDETRLKRPLDAVEALQAAARVRPSHPLPRLEVARLLREANEPKRLFEALLALAEAAPETPEARAALFDAAEVQELVLGDGEAALKTLRRLEGAGDPAVLEAEERILVRRGNAAELAALYGRWLDEKPPAPVDYALRVALAEALSAKEPERAAALLEGLVTAVPEYLPGLRMLSGLARRLGAPGPLAAALAREAEVLRDRALRAGVRWELAALEDKLEPALALEALARIAQDTPHDASAHDAIVRIAGKLVGAVGDDRPAAQSARAQTLASLAARRELGSNPVARALSLVEEALLIETSPAPAEAESTQLRAALAAYRASLGLFPEGLLAARGTSRLAGALGDRAALVFAETQLARLVFGAPAQAAHLVRAGALLAEEPAQAAQARALALFEEALRTDPDSPAAASSVARMLAVDPARLCERLGDALERAKDKAQIRLLALEIGRAVLSRRDPGAGVDPNVGIAALRRALAEAPGDPEALALSARLHAAARLFPEAESAWRRVVELGGREEKTAAHFELAALYAGPLGDLPRAEAELEALLTLDPRSKRALEELFRVASTRGDKARAAKALARLAEGESDPSARLEYDLRLADACRDAGDMQGAIRALIDAIVTSPSDPRGFSTLARAFRVETAEGASAYVRALGQLVDVAAAQRTPTDPKWLTTMGLLEITVLVRPRDGLLHLQQAVQLPGAGPETRLAFGRGLEAAGKNAEAVQALRDVLTESEASIARAPDLSAALAALESALAKDGRSEERLAVEEVRACLGEVKAERLARLRSRRLPEAAPYPLALAGGELYRLLVPEAAPLSPLLGVATALAPVAAKALRFELSALGVSSRDRLSGRDMHPSRLLAERIGRAVGVEHFELYLTSTWQGALRVYPGDPPAIVGHHSFAELPELEQAFALGRLFVRIAFGVAWLDELPVEAADGLLVAAVRVAEPAFGSGELGPAREQAAQSMMPAVQRAIGRRQRKAIEEIAAGVPASYDPRAFLIGLRRTEYRAGYALAGDLISAIDYLRRFDAGIGRSVDDPRLLLAHPVTNELIRYALSAEGYAERHRLGAVWPQI